MAVAAAGAAGTEEGWVEAATESPTKQSGEQQRSYITYIYYITLHILHVICSLISRDKSDQEEGAVSSNPPAHLCQVPQPPNPASAIQQDIVSAKSCIFSLFR